MFILTIYNLDINSIYPINFGGASRLGCLCTTEENSCIQLCWHELRAKLNFAKVKFFQPVHGQASSISNQSVAGTFIIKASNFENYQIQGLLFKILLCFY